MSRKKLHGRMYDDQINDNAKIEAIRLIFLADYLYSIGSSMYQEVFHRSVEEIGTNMNILRKKSDVIVMKLKIC